MEARIAALSSLSTNIHVGWPILEEWTVNVGCCAKTLGPINPRGNAIGIQWKQGLIGPRVFAQHTVLLINTRMLW